MTKPRTFVWPTTPEQEARFFSDIVEEVRRHGRADVHVVDFEPYVHPFHLPNQYGLTPSRLHRLRQTGKGPKYTTSRHRDRIQYHYRASDVLAWQATLAHPQRSESEPERPDFLGEYASFLNCPDYH